MILLDAQMLIMYLVIDHVLDIVLLFLIAITLLNTLISMKEDVYKTKFVLMLYQFMTTVSIDALNTRIIVTKTQKTNLIFMVLALMTAMFGKCKIMRDILVNMMELLWNHLKKP